MRARIDLVWRIAATGFSFSAFGLGALLILVSLFPLLHLTAFDRGRANRRCQFVVHISFRVFVWLMRTLGVLSYERHNTERLRDLRGTVIVANHPTLIDVVFIVAMLPTALCVVKRSAWSNPFLAGIMWATGYVPDGNPMQLVDACTQSLENGCNVVIFPEATRSVPGQELRLRRGAASIIRASRKAFIPIIITCEPPTLVKGEKWFQVPDRKAHFKITIGERVDPLARNAEAETYELTSRKINKLFEEIFRSGIERHECVG